MMEIETPKCTITRQDVTVDDTLLKETLEQLDTFVSTSTWNPDFRAAVKNERYLHHAFSHYFALRHEALWTCKIPFALCPEEPTSVEVPDSTRGNLDFMCHLDSNKTVALEFKGPDFTSLGDLEFAFGKLLRQGSNRNALVMLVTSSTSGLYNHIPNLCRRVSEALVNALKSLGGAGLLSSLWLDIYLKTYPDFEMAQKYRAQAKKHQLTLKDGEEPKTGVELHWGPFTGGKQNGTPLEQAYFALENRSQKSNT